MNSNYDSVKEQSGLFAGQGGYNITVGNHTQLDGAVIASTADKDKNLLDTGTLGWSDIHNQADYKSEHQSAGFSSGGSIGANLMSNMSALPIGNGGGSGHAEGTTKSAVSEGGLIIRHQTDPSQDVSQLNRDTENANEGAIDPIFDKEKEQKRLRQAQLVSDIASQSLDIYNTYESTKATHSETDNSVKTGVNAVVRALQALAGGDIKAALAQGAAPYLAEKVKEITTDNADYSTLTETQKLNNLMAHAILGGVVAELSGGNGAAGAIGAATGELAAPAIALVLYGTSDSKELTSQQKDNISALATLASGIAGGVSSDSTAGAATGAQAGKNAVENNFLGATSSDKLDKAVEKIKNGDKSLATANELIKLENADKRSDALVDKFTRDPSQMSSAEQAELAGYLRVYASEMEREHGSAVSQELVKGLLSGQDYMKRNPDSEAMSKAQTIMNTWGYHKSNASIGDAPAIFVGSVLGVTVKGMAANAAIGVGVNTGVQLTGKDPFSYVDAIMAGVTAAATTGKGIGLSAAINMAGAAVGSGIKGEDPTNSVIGAGVGSVAGSVGGKVVDALSPVTDQVTKDVVGAVTGSAASELTGNAVKSELDKRGKAQ
ncbi:VENN motif pre-toxin domain-containing protein [Lonsdalea quercina]|uniref:VENN motif pre-toxin domain-containing protein n=1 Tax=Lonsdalea quercina TaxID=71657 RepID=UPI00397663AB